MGNLSLRPVELTLKIVSAIKVFWSDGRLAQSKHSFCLGYLESKYVVFNSCI
jgi:hypothetical protein